MSLPGSRRLGSGLLELDHLKDTVLHFLDGLELRQAHAPLVGDVVHTALGLGVLTAGACETNRTVSDRPFFGVPHTDERIRLCPAHVDNYQSLSDS